MKHFLCVTFILFIVASTLGSVSSASIVEIEFLIDSNRWKDYQEKYGRNPMTNIRREIDELLEDASRHLGKLDHGGYKLHLNKPVERLEDSLFNIRSTYKDRRNNNRTRRLEKQDIVGYAFAFQDAVASSRIRTQPNIVRFILASDRIKGVKANPTAAAEEFCLCNPSTFACIGIYTSTNNLPDAVLLAHEIGHTLGAFPHDRQPGFIMSDPIQTKKEYVWSPLSRNQINRNNLECLELENRPIGSTTRRPRGSAIIFPNGK